MSSTAAGPAIACGLLLLSIVLAIVLIPVLDAELRRATARKDALLSQLTLPEDVKDPAP